MKHRFKVQATARRRNRRPSLIGFALDILPPCGKDWAAPEVDIGLAQLVDALVITNT